MSAIGASSYLLNGLFCENNVHTDFGAIKTTQNINFSEIMLLIIMSQDSFLFLHDN